MRATLVALLALAAAVQAACDLMMRGTEVCHPHPQPFSVGHFNLTKTLMPTLLRKNRLVLVVVSSSNLPLARLCNFESGVQALFDFFGEKLRVTRLDCAEDHWSKECSEEDSAHQEFPRYVLYVDRKRYALSRSDYFSGVVLQIRKLVGEEGWADAVFQLASKETDSDRDLDLLAGKIWGVQKDFSGRLVDRIVVLGVFADPQNTETLKKQFRQNALKLLWRTDVRFVATEDPRIAERLKRRRPQLFAGQPGLNTVAVIKLRNRFDPDDEVSVFNKSARLPLEGWLFESLLSLVEELTWHNQDSFNNEMPLLVLFLDPAADRQKNLDYMEGFRKLAQTHLYKINFAWCDYQDNLRLMKLLGVEGFR